MGNVIHMVKTIERVLIVVRYLKGRSNIYEMRGTLWTWD
jgi:hypothetical protein